MLSAPSTRRTPFSRPLAVVTAASVGLLLCSVLLPRPAQAGQADDGGGAASAPSKPDKSQYNLFNPTPDGLMREFKTARPDQTTGPGTVDAGHFYVEIGAFQQSLDLGASRSSAWIPLQSSHLRLGLTNTIEFEVIYDGFYNQNTRALGGGSARRSDETINGSGNTTLRLRFNLLGDDGGPISFAVEPQLNLPTATERAESEHFTGSVNLPVSFKLPAGFSGVAQVQPGVTRDADDNRYEASVNTGLTLYHNLFRKEDRVEPYLEYYDTVVTGRHGTHSGQVDVGVRWQPIKNYQFDFGCNFGVTADAPDYQPFVGLSARF